MATKNNLIKDKSIKLSLKAKCEILALNRSNCYYKAKPCFREEYILKKLSRQYGALY